MMSKKSVLALLVAGGIFAASAAHADHNSIWGAGTANMPNDIHNSAIEDDQEVFLDLVQYGNGADSVNRYDDTTDDSTMEGATMTTGSALRSTTTRGAMGTRTMGASRGGYRR